MSSALTLELDWEPGTLQRLLGLIERRGFEIVALELVGCGRARRIALEVQPQREPRDFSVLCRQVDRLHGMRRIESPEAPPLRQRLPLVG